MEKVTINTRQWFVLKWDWGGSRDHVTSTYNECPLMLLYNEDTVPPWMASLLNYTTQQFSQALGFCLI